jgi:putative transposase
VRSFETVEEWRAALIEFKQFYNETWILERPGYKTQAQIRQQQSGRLAEVA